MTVSRKWTHLDDRHGREQISEADRAYARGWRTSSRPNHGLTTVVTSPAPRRGSAIDGNCPRRRAIPTWFSPGRAGHEGFRLDHLAQEFGRHPGILVGEFDVHRLTIHDRQLVAEFVAEVAIITDVAHGADEIPVIRVRVAADDPVDPVVAADRAVGPTLELAAEVRQDLEVADLLRRLLHDGRALVGHEGGVEADLQVRRVHLLHHPQDVAVIVDERAMVLESERDARVSGVSRALDQGVAAPSPDLLGGELLVDDGPVALGDVVGGQLGMSRDAPPGQEHAQGRALPGRPSSG